MATIAKMVVELGLDQTGFDKGLKGARSSIDAWSGSMRRTGTLMSAAITTPFAAAGTALVRWAASSENAVGKVESVFDSNASGIVAWSKTTAKSMGISGTAALQASGMFGGFFRSSGIAMNQTADMSTSLVTLAADMGAFNDVSADRATEAGMRLRMLMSPKLGTT